MDLVSTIRKDGKSRGGQGDFSWENLKDDKHRENYLGHSLKAPVGRWQKGRDLTWWSKGAEGEDAEKEAEQQRLEEIRKLKEAEQNAMYEALGFKGPQPAAGLGMPTLPGAANPNLEALGTKRKVGGEKSRDRERSPRRRDRREDRHRHRHRDQSRSRSRSRERRRKDHARRQSRSRSRSPERHGHGHRSRRSDKRSRSRSRSRQRSRDRPRRHDEEPRREYRAQRSERRHRQSSRDRSRERRHRSRELSREREKGEQLAQNSGKAHDASD